MATASYWQRGEALDYVNSTANTIAANTIIKVGNHIGVTGNAIAPAMVGSLHMTGVFTMPKTGTAAIAMGQTVYWDGSGITDDADDGAQSNTVYYTEVGYAATAATAAATEILVKLNG